MLIWVILLLYYFFVAAVFALIPPTSTLYLKFSTINKVSIACKMKLYAVFTSFRFFFLATPFTHFGLLTARSFYLLFAALKYYVKCKPKQKEAETTVCTLFDWKAAVAVGVISNRT